MQGMNDKEFDAYIRKRAEEYDIPYRPQAWERMRAKLDRSRGAGGSGMRGIVAGLLIVLLLGTTIFWYYDHSASSSVAVRKTGRPPESSPAVQVPSAVPSSPELRTSIPPPAGQDTHADEQTTHHKHITDRLLSAPVIQQVNRQARWQEKSLQQSRLERTKQQGAALQPLTLLSSLSWNKLPDIQPGRSSLSLQLQDNSRLLAYSTESSTMPEPAPFYRTSISLSVSPDLSAIGLGNISQVGAESGLGLEVFLWRNLSLNIGAVFSHKIYAATEGYQFSSGYGNTYDEPEQIDAQCKVLDIPVNLRYYALNLNSSRVFLSSGLSSYLMLTEDYFYRYGRYYEHMNRTVSARNSNQHYFRVLNLSAGYERRWNRHWSLLAEPFVKLPLAGVGEGKVKLATAGLFLSVKRYIGPNRAVKK